MASQINFSCDVVPQNKNDLVKFIIDWTTSADGSFSDYLIPYDYTNIVLGWFCFLAKTFPFAPNPTAGYDIEILDGDGFDIMGGKLMNRSATASQVVVPKIDELYGSRIVDSVLTLRITNNAVASAKGRLKLYIGK